MTSVAFPLEETRDVQVAEVLRVLDGYWESFAGILETAVQIDTEAAPEVATFASHKS